jgi:dCMP deaminase
VSAGRPTWDYVWMTCAEVLAERSLCSRSKVGCVIVTADNRVESATYNGPGHAFEHNDRPCTEWCDRAMRGEEPSPTYDDCPSGHAEANSIARSDWSKLKKATLYSTSNCCMGCAKTIVQTGILRVVHYVDETLAHRSTEAVEGFLLRHGVTVFRWEHGIAQQMFTLRSPGLRR